MNLALRPSSCSTTHNAVGIKSLWISNTCCCHYRISNFVKNILLQTKIWTNYYSYNTFVLVLDTKPTCLMKWVTFFRKIMCLCRCLHCQIRWSVPLSSVSKNTSVSRVSLTVFLVHVFSCYTQTPEVSFLTSSLDDVEYSPSIIHWT